MKGKLSILIYCLLFIVFISSCNPSINSSISSSPGTYPVDAAFSDFYREFGGSSILGPAISPPFMKDGISYQYVLSGLMVYEPSQIPLNRFHFSSIASVVWNINDLIEPAPVDATLPYINGHRIWEDVVPFYQHYGLDIIGLPVTGVKPNDEKQRYEQYFEGLGFFRNYSDPPSKIQLLPYGVWMCGSNCQYQISDIVPPSASYSRDYSETEQLFLQASERLGYGFTGSPLAQPKMGMDGYYEMVFENVVMYIDPSDGNQIKLRPLPSWLGIQAEQPTQETKADWLSFFQTGEGLGYNVPTSFSIYLSSHGEKTYSGDPINEYRLLADSGYSQCFTNMCLEYHPTAPEQLQIRPHPLGIEYQRNGLNPSIPTSSLSEALQVNVWEQNPIIPSGQIQIINIQALRNDAPVNGMILSLVVKQPDGIIKSYQSTPTDMKGMTSIELDPINGPNGAIVQYQVCILDEVTSQVCFSRNYTIWNQ